jgi:hypothetical protein
MTTTTNEAAERLHHGCDQWHARGNKDCACYCHDTDNPAGRLTGYIWRDVKNPERAQELLDEALAAERRPLAEALRDAAILFHRHTHDADWVRCNSPECKRFRAILDEEAAR